MPKTTLPPRDEIPLEQTWNLASIFTSVEAWESAYEEVKTKLPDVKAIEGTLDKGPKNLLVCLKTVEETLRLAQKVLVYGMLESSVDVSNQEAAARSGQGRGLMAQAATAAAFLDPELMAIGF